VPIHFICPHCAAAVDVAEKYAGQTGPCAHCGKAITILSPGGVVPAPSRITTTAVIVIAAVVLGVAVLAAGIVAAFLLPRVSPGALESEHRARCVSNLQQIALAMQQYEAANGCFPPAYIADKHGKPMHSWRVLLLPYLEQQDLYDRYRFGEPWNSSNNRAVTDLAIGLFQCPSQPDAKEPITNYMMVVGPHTISSGSESRQIAEITDGLANTIMLVEVADSATWWAEPEDLHFDKLHFTINGSKRQGISSYHPHGANVAFCDGSVRLLKDSTNPQLVKAMLTIDGGETVPNER
jgi:prepilin-type processing-associated H-X9-DG protein